MLPPRLLSPRSPCPLATFVLAFLRRSAASDRLTLTSFLNCAEELVFAVLCPFANRLSVR
jgi:hypothetical protein